MMDNYSLRMSMNRYLNTGNPVMDWVLTGFVTTLLMGLAGYLKKENLIYFFSIIKKFIFPNKNKSQINQNQVTISSRSILMTNPAEGWSQTKQDTLDSLRQQNEYMIKAIYWYLNQRREAIQKVDLGLSFNKNLDFIDEQVRDNHFLIRPTEELILQNGIRVKCSLDHEKKIKTKNKDVQPNGEINSTETCNEKLEETITLTTEKPINFLLNFLEEVWKKYIDMEYPVVTRNKENQKWYFVKSQEDKYNRYPLVSKVTFDDVFFPGKDKFLRRVNQFLEKKTKFSSFKILAHGNPGGGKTSMIKALHNYTGFHIIVVRLSQIKDMSELMELFYSPTIKKKTGGIANISIKKRIYLLEDIDADSKLVHKRTDEKDEDDEDDKNILPNIIQRPIPSNQLKSSNLSSVTDPSKSALTEKSMIIDTHWDNWYSKKMEKNSSGITLANILNLFDGVLELDGCFVVMTTNHPEKLDPALIRDGRISFKIELKEITPPHMKSMISNFHSNEMPDPKIPHPELDPILTQLPKMMPCAFEKLVEHEDNLQGVIKNLMTQISNKSSEAAEAL